MDGVQFFTGFLGYLRYGDRNFHTGNTMTVITYLFWISLAVLFYCYIGYGILVALLKSGKSFFRSAPPPVVSFEPVPVTVVVSSYNEGEVLKNKILNTLALDYPPEHLKIIFVTDGSTDDSNRIISGYPAITLLHQPERKGKYAAIKRAMQLVDTPVVVFSDANTLLNRECLKKIIPHFTDERVGGVAGEKKIVSSRFVSAVGEAEGIYWQYESFMKKLDAGFYTVVGAAGELFSIRTALFKSLAHDLILDDFIISMQICLQGYKIEYEPGAFATEPPSASLADEEKRKVRISAGAYQSIGYLKECLNFFKHPALSFQYISRRLLRWVFCPVTLVILLVSNILICNSAGHAGFYNGFLSAQLFFYLVALIGWLFVRSGKRAGLFTIPFYFVFMNYCLVKGFTRFVRGKQTVLWEKSLRQAVE